MAKGKRQKDYERTGTDISKSRWGYVLNEPPKLRKRDVFRKMIQDSKGKR